MGSSSKAQVVGYRYSFDIHFAIGLAIDELVEIRASDKTAWKGSVTSSQTIFIDAPNLFGGDKGEGGIQGNLDVMFGDEDQQVNPRLAASLGGLVPAFRGFASGFFSGLVTSINPYPKTWKILRRRALKGWDGEAWYPAKCVISLADGQIKAMNAAHILYETYTNREWARGLDRSLMDDVAWRAAADQLFTENFGLCLEWKVSGSLADFRDQICDHIGAYVGPDRLTGLITITLVRDNYVVADLPIFDEDTGLLSIEEEEASSSTLPPSQLLVKYVDAITGETRTARAINAAMAQSQGGPSIETVEYLGIPTGELAGRVASRDMRIKGSGLRRYKVKLDRRAYAVAPGKAFRIRSLKRGIGEIVVRAGRIEDGTMINGAITITAVQDVFGLPATSYVKVPPSGWVPPDSTPKTIVTRRLIEMPYRELASRIDPANLALLDVTSAWYAALAVRPSGLSLSYSITSRLGATGDFIERGTGDWCPIALLVGQLLPEQRVVTFTGGVDLEEVVIGSAALIDEEIVRVDAFNRLTGSITLGRGCADTVPATHAPGATIWMYEGYEGEDEFEYSSGVTVQSRLLTNTSQGQLLPALAGIDSVVLKGRQGRPYPPGLFRIAGSAYPSNVVGPLTITWAHRDRLNQADQLIDTSLGSIGPEAGTTYSCRVLQADNLAVLDSQTGLNGSTTTSLAPQYDGEVIIELWSVRSNLESWQRLTHTFNYQRSEPRATENNEIRITESGESRIMEA